MARKASRSSGRNPNACCELTLRIAALSPCYLWCSTFRSRWVNRRNASSAVAQSATATRHDSSDSARAVGEGSALRQAYRPLRDDCQVEIGTRGGSHKFFASAPATLMSFFRVDLSPLASNTITTSPRLRYLTR